MVETSRDWSEKLPFALWAYRTSFRTSTGATPYSLVYGMEAVLPVEIEMGSLRVALEQQIPETDWAQARFDQLNLLDERRLRAADHVRAYQRKMARAFKKRVKPRPLHVEGAGMADGFRWNQFSEPTNVDQLKRARSSHYLCSPLHHCISSHLTVRVIHHIFFILSTVRFTSSSFTPWGDPPHFITWRVVMSFPLSIPRTLIQGSSV
ncbi:hypothetical protein CK203_062108 [Vitis vinifera]|uniref:Uncharacterized protein n=1 Tax=Vitis vinifera TaxID=29760 RepID=A0A438GMW0_VITVI|nr:hypothetical protein CK203_062108 [Vitis vinifera]